ncbi:hypothetical protein PS918_01184 [Pseudomonas fluorescens]|uniref:Uncharacterized protein n=1 Tax=Pseudomonas fluorescens TaxID=294 RepID=A0A5E7RKB0_PSEFL|nr:hypothetical protein [Pseudomonas fluorescens]VVP71413.1 hypothetical protein PS918_01184 [Pseudomonas fluorescens]
MPDYLLNEEDFKSLKAYINFLNELPPALKVIEAFTESIRRQGHQMLAPPDAHMLLQAAQGNAGSWQAIRMSIPLIGQGVGQAVRDTRLFIEEFHIYIKNPVNGKTRFLDMDIGHFSLTTSHRWGREAPVNVSDLLRALFNGLLNVEQAILSFMSAVTSIGISLHGIFIRFIESLTLELCSCDKTTSKIEAYYGLGKVELPGMQLDLQRPYSEQERMANAREHIARLRSMHLHATSAVDNLTDFCYRLQYLLADARGELQADHPAQTLVRLGIRLNFVRDSLVEVNPMTERLLEISKRLR